MNRFAGKVCDPGECEWEATAWKTQDVVQWQHRKMDERKYRTNQAGLALEGENWCEVLHGWPIVMPDDREGKYEFCRSVYWARIMSLYQAKKT